MILFNCNNNSITNEIYINTSYVYLCDSLHEKYSIKIIQYIEKAWNTFNILKCVTEKAIEFQFVHHHHYLAISFHIQNSFYFNVIDSRIYIFSYSWFKQVKIFVRIGKLKSNFYQQLQLKSKWCMCLWIWKKNHRP